MKTLETGMKKGKMKLVNLQNGLYLGNQNPLHAENGIKWLLRHNPSCTLIYELFEFFCFMNINKTFRI